MGAHECNVLKIGRYESAKTAYKAAVDDANWEHGHDGYNGTISTSDGFRMITNHPRYGTKKFWKFYEDKLDDTKWSRWNCIEFKGTLLKKVKEEEGYKGKRNIKAFYFWGLAAS